MTWLAACLGSFSCSTVTLMTRWIRINCLKPAVLCILEFFNYKLAPVETDTTDIVGCEYVTSLFDLLCAQLSQVQSLWWAVRTVLVAFVGGISRLIGQSCLYTLWWAAAPAGARPPLLLPWRHAVTGLHLPQPRNTHQYDLPPQVYIQI